MNQFSRTELIIGKDGIINPNFSKEIWIGNYCITINIH